MTAPTLHAPASRFHTRLRVPGSADVPVRHWMPVHVHLGASDILGRVALLEGEVLAPGEAMLAELILEKPVGALWGDHFILRDQLATRTLGGGRVLDIFPPSRHKRAAERLDYLRLLDQADPQPALAHALARQFAGVNLDRYALNRNLATDEAQALWRDMGLVVIDEAGGRSGFSPENWQALRGRLLEAARVEHARPPDMIGVERDRLRRLALPTLSRAAFDRLTFELGARAEYLTATGAHRDRRAEVVGVDPEECARGRRDTLHRLSREARRDVTSHDLDPSILTTLNPGPGSRRVE